jgi:hypothetical protein
MSKSLIHGWDEAFAISSFQPAERLRDFSGPPQGARWQYRGQRFWSVGFRDVFHAERVVSFASARAGERTWPVQLSDPVRDHQNSLR